MSDKRDAENWRRLMERVDETERSAAEIFRPAARVCRDLVGLGHAHEEFMGTVVLCFIREARVVEAEIRAEASG